ncbi:MAG: ferrous iron transport protein A [Clostridiaceae bacterium]|nr:ferrous iron transport protein A [Clostridiaceae bacterium]MBW4860174.1 ferrous iron transport protein A [Clostridiaceae bacterium]MBW4869151.1 ferrous iron transport protein A [Clostridiaceae bacterium]
MKSLDEMPLGSKAKVKQISKNASVRRRLMDMGVVPGVEIEIKGKAPLGDPIEILLRGYKLTLRKNEAANILVE